MELISLIVITLVSILSILYAYFKYSFQYWKSRGVPCDSPSIPYGTLNEEMHLGLLNKQWYDKYKPTGAKFFGAYLWARPIAVLMDLELVKSVLIKDFANFNERGFYSNEVDDPLSGHLLSLDGEKWRKLRVKLTPTFTSGKMKFMFPTVVEVGERFRDCLLEVIKQHEELEIKELLARYTTDVIGTCAFGIECNSLKDPNAEFRHYGRMQFTNKRHHPFVFMLWSEFQSLGRTLHIKATNEEISTFFLKVVRDTVEYREKNNVNRNDFMDLLIKLKNEETNDKEKTITLNEIAAQAFLFFVAGFETSSTTLTFCMYELAFNPDIQTKARQAIQEALKKYNGQFTHEMLMDLPYIDQVFEETLRKWPPVTDLHRVAKNDYQIPGTKMIIEKGTTVQIPALAIQRDPENFPDPEKFDPDRFTSEEKQKRPAMAWLPFGDGPRNCIGLRFGMMQAKIGLVTLLRNFEFSLGSKTTVPLVIDKHSSVISSEGGVYLKLKPIAE